MNKNNKLLKQILLDAVGYKDGKVFEELQYIQSNKKEYLYEIETTEVYQNINTKDFIKFTSSSIDKETQEISFTNKLVGCNSYFYVLFSDEGSNASGSYTYCLDICSYKVGSIVQLYYDTDVNEFVLGTDYDLQFTFGSTYLEKDIHKLMTGVLPILYSYLSVCNNLLKEYKTNSKL